MTIFGHRHAALMHWWNSLRFRQLLILIMLAMLMTPLWASHDVIALAFQFVFFNALVVTLSAVKGRQPTLRVWVMGLWAAATVLKIVHVAGGGAEFSKHMLVATAALDALLMGSCVVVVLEYVLSGREVNSERIFAAVVTYFLVGFAFAAVYELLVILQPGSFLFPGGALKPGEVVVDGRLLYFSFVTITTLGYGDIVPQLPLSQMLSVIEAIVGQFYIAVIVAWLVTAYAARR
jgi:voltage-gated potassium channel Kch